MIEFVGKSRVRKIGRFERFLVNEWTRRHQVLFVRKRRENESVVDGEGTDGVGRMLLSWRHNGVLIGTLTRFDLLLFLSYS